jgi:hypothetical protein
LQLANKNDVKNKFMTLNESMRLNKLTIVSTGDIRDLVLMKIPNLKNPNTYYEDEIIEDEPDPVPPQPAPVPQPAPEPAIVAPPQRKGTRLRFQTDKITASLENTLATALGKSKSRRKKK